MNRRNQAPARLRSTVLLLRIERTGDRLTEDYMLWAHRKTHLAVRDTLSGMPRGRLLDIAAGEGAMSAAAAEMGFQVSACDLQPENFKAPGVECAPCDLDKNLPFPDASFDCAVCIEAVEHLQNRYAFLAECARILRPGGTLILTTPNVLNLAARLKFLLTGFFPLFARPPGEFVPHPTHTHINPIPYYYLRHALVVNSFKITRVCTDRYRKSSIMLAWLWPVIILASIHSVRKEADLRQRAANREILATMRSGALLFGRTLIIVAERV